MERPSHLARPACTGELVAEVVAGQQLGREVTSSLQLVPLLVSLLSLDR